MKTTSNGVTVMHFYESCRLAAYPDPATGGAPWTIGYGCTGPGIEPGLTWTKEKADQEFVGRLVDEFEPGVDRLVKVPLSPGQFDALVSLAYNIGLRNLGGSTLVKMLNAGDVDGAAAQFPRWNRAAGKPMRGLTRRRYSEQALFNGAGGTRAITIGQAAA